MHATLQLIQSLFTFHPRLRCHVEASTFPFPGSATLTCPPSFLHHPSPSRTHMKTCLREALCLTHAQHTCVLPFSLPETAGGGSSHGHLHHAGHSFNFPASDTTRHRYSPSNHRRPAGARPRPSRTFLFRKGAVSCLHRVGRVTSFIQFEGKGMPCGGAPTGRRGSAGHAPAWGPLPPCPHAPGGRHRSPAPPAWWRMTSPPHPAQAPPLPRLRGLTGAAPPTGGGDGGQGRREAAALNGCRAGRGGAGGARAGPLARAEPAAVGAGVEDGRGGRELSGRRGRGRPGPFGPAG